MTEPDEDLQNIIYLIYDNLGLDEMLVDEFTRGRAFEKERIANDPAEILNLLRGEKEPDHEARRIALYAKKQAETAERLAKKGNRYP